jgi:hypothetical protein
MMRTAAVMVVAVGALGCGDAGGLCDQSLASSTSALSPPPPESVAALARDVRRVGGLVFRGAVVGGRRSLPPVRVMTGTNLTLVSQRAGATVRVTDALGGAAPSAVDIVSRTGRDSVVDSLGCPAGGSSGLTTSTQQEVPAEGEWVFFVYQLEGQRVMTWRAAIVGDAVSNEGTMAQGSVPIGDLRAME